MAIFKDKEDVTLDTKKSGNSSTGFVPKKKKDHNFLYYINPGHLKAAINGYGFTFDFKKDLGRYAVFIILEIALAYFFNLQIGYAILFILIGAMFIPNLLVISYKNMYEQRRFYDANVYMEQLLYSFKKTKNFLASLEDIKIQFKDGPMHDVIVEAIDHIKNTFSDNANPEQEAADIIEANYKSVKINTIHRFILKAEHLGGGIDNTTQLLLEDRSAWESRTETFQKEKQHRKTLVIASIAITVLLCLVFVRMPPIMTKLDGIDISHNAAVELGTIAMWFLDILLYTKTMKKLSSDWLDDGKEVNQEEIVNKYYKVINYNFKEEKMKSIKLALLPIGLTVLFFALNIIPVAIIAGVIAVFCLFQDKIDYSLARKAVIREINLKFPQWLTELALLLQSESSQVAIMQSAKTAPAVLQPALQKFQKELQENPKSVDPYVNFLSEFDIKQVGSAMKMLYSISAGTGGSPDEQIADIMRRNIAMLDVVEAQENSNKMASLLIYFLAPQIIGSSKLLIDMLIFFVVALGSMSTGY